MLVLDRKLHEGFWIDDRIFVKVLAIGRHRVKLGIEAPADLPVVREELRETNESMNGALKERSLRSTRERSL
jgi:carbon storage regulator